MSRRPVMLDSGATVKALTFRLHGSRVFMFFLFFSFSPYYAPSPLEC